MPRVKSKNGTRRSTVVARRQRQGKAFRISPFFRRTGIICIVLLSVLWAGAWLTTSGIVERTNEKVTAQFYKTSAQDGFAVRDILVEGRKNADRDVLLGLIGAQRGDPIFAFDPGKARAALEKETWIESARVERRLPGVIYVSIRERTPFALWQSQKKLRLIDPQGIVITDVAKDMARFRNLPLVVGEGAPKEAFALLDLMKAEPAVMQRLEAAMYVGDRRWDLKLKNNITVRLPEDDLALALRRLGEAQEKDALLDKDMDTIDLREPRRMVIRTKPNAEALDYKANYQPDKAI
jgi:cell division protein FtsQ